MILKIFTCEHLSEVCYVEKEPMSAPLNGESFNHLTANTSNEARCDESELEGCGTEDKKLVYIKVSI